MKSIVVIGMLSVAVGSMVIAQEFSDLGQNGTSISMIPTTTVVPASHFRMQLARSSGLSGPRYPVSWIDLTTGFSDHLEVYLKVAFEETGSITPLPSYGYGGKLVLPVSLPRLHSIALWIDGLSIADGEIAGEGFSRDILRSGFVIGPGRRENGKLRSWVLGGWTLREDGTRMLAGIGVSKPTSSSLKLGGEVLYGYEAEGEWRSSISAVIRVLPFISLQVNPGFIRTPHTRAQWFISTSICVASTGIDFWPMETMIEEDEIPSIEEIERQLKEEGNKPSDQQQ